MRKIMFNDKYCLTQAVLEGSKTMTRRIIPEKESKRLDIFYGGDDWYYAVQTCIDESSRFDIGEKVAVAQAYKDIAWHTNPNAPLLSVDRKELFDTAGKNNKLFVKAELMPHHIRITDIKVERLQDISNEDCLNEGILERTIMPFNVTETMFQVPNTTILKPVPRESFAALIDKVSGKGTWDSNPWVFAYSFELVD